jgi:glycosyltransferase involved in cell wall biosynthesis
VDVELFTSRFDYGQAPEPRSYSRHEFFYRLSHSGTAAGARSRLRLLLKLGEHVPDMLRYRRRAKAAQVVHFQWLTLQPLDLHLLPSGRALVLTAHDVLPREPRPGQLRAQRELYRRMDAIVVHSQHGRRRLVDEFALDDDRVHVIPHGLLTPWEGLAEQSLPPVLDGVSGPVVLFFGLLRPYKGLDVLLEAWRGIEEAELWIVGMPRMDITALREQAPHNVRFLPRFIADAQIPAFLKRASLVVLPYREIDQSGVLFTALGLGVPLLLSDAGGFPEVAEHGCADIVAAGDVDALRSALLGLLGDPARLSEMAARAGELAQSQYSWKAIARAHLDLYEQLL